MNQKSFFASSTIYKHILRGLAGAGLFILALYLSVENWRLAVLVGILALIMLRGCPTCRLIGLIETVRRSFASVK